MMGTASALRRVYNYAALLALLHVGASAAVIVYAIATGGLTVPKLKAAMAALGSEPASTPVPEETVSTAPDSGGPSTVQEPPVKVTDHGSDFAEAQTGLDIVRLEAERLKAEIDQRLALNNSILLKVASERESFQRERQAALDREKAAKPDARGEGFSKQIAIFENLTPKVAIEHLLAMGDPDDAARVLIALEPRKAKAIIEAAKREDQSKKMKDILQRVRAVTAEAPASGARASTGSSP